MDDSEEKRDRIGWFQLQLLLQLAFRPKYGYEIINEMKINDIKISTGQVYPALKKLENSEYLKSFSKKGKAARRKYYEITSKGLEAVRNTIRPMIFNLLPAIYTLLADIKKTIFDIAEVQEGDKVLLYSDPIKQPLLDLARIVGYDGEVFITVNTPASFQTVNDFALFYNLEKVIKPVILNDKFKIQLESNLVDHGVFMCFQRKTRAEVQEILNEIKRCTKKNSAVYILSTEPGLLSETFLNFFDFSYGYEQEEIMDFCKVSGLKIE
ncbi:MAG: PadR family transcriptional regulator, partial [Promethearchaeota archaeon]